MLTPQERRARQGRATIYSRLLAAGFSPETIEEACEQRPNLRSFGLTACQDEFGSDPVLGITYSGDYRSEEETGLVDLRKNLSEGSHQAFFCTALTFNGLPAYVALTDSYHSYHFGAALIEAHERFTKPPMDRRDCWRLTVAEMKSELRGKVKPLPRRRDEVERAYLEHVRGVMPAHEPVGEFATGRSLVLIPTTALLTLTLDLLFTEAVEANALRLGTPFSPEHGGAMFYDERDVSEEELARQAAELKWVEERMAEAAEVQQALRTVGHLYAIKPGVLQRPGTAGVAQLYYFINFYYREEVGLEKKSVFGWFTLEELAAIARVDKDFLVTHEESWR